MRGAARAGAACPEPARPGRDLGPARRRAARRLRGLARHGLTQTGRSLAAGERQAYEFGAAAPQPLASAARPRAAQRDDRRCLAARALSEMLCDEPNAARCRATVRPAGDGRSISRVSIPRTVFVGSHSAARRRCAKVRPRRCGSARWAIAAPLWRHPCQCCRLRHRLRPSVPPARAIGLRARWRQRWATCWCIAATTPWRRPRCWLRAMSASRIGLGPWRRRRGRCESCRRRAIFCLALLPRAARASG